MLLKEMYDTAISSTVPVVMQTIVDEIKRKIMNKQALPYYINSIDMSSVSRNYLKDIMLQEHGVIISYHPHGIIVEKLI